MGYPEKRKRNDDIMKMYKMGVPIRAIARAKNLKAHQTVREIIERRLRKEKAGVA